MPRIASHNVFWFQGRPFAPDTPGAPEPRILEALAALHRRLGADLVCFQEIQDEACFRLTRAALGMDGAYTRGSATPQYGAAAFWKTGRLLADSGAAPNPPQRVWQLAEIPAGTGSLAVANCHLPSSRHIPEEEAAKCRIAELDSLMTGSRRPDVILGDFNEQPGGGLGRFLAGSGYLDAAVLNGRQDLGTTPGSGRGDQIWVRRELASAVTGYGVAAEPEMRTELAGKEHLSDHFPLWVDISEGTRP
jgi:endonuclease/exonuclease/phosphatase family metal-dependent hydrolase